MGFFNSNPAVLQNPAHGRQAQAAEVSVHSDWVVGASRTIRDGDAGAVVDVAVALVAVDVGSGFSVCFLIVGMLVRACVDCDARERFTGEPVSVLRRLDNVGKPTLIPISVACRRLNLHERSGN